MTDARKRAEEALARWDALPSGDVDDLAAWDVARDGMERFRALLASEPETKHPGHDRIAELESLLRECNAVCLCGCPDSEHESYGEDGESCGDEEHECIRVPSAVLAYVQDLRQNWADLGEDYEGLRARINPPHPSWDTSCARCGRDLTVSSATCGECCAETPAAGVVEVTPAPPSPAGAEVREALAEIVEWSASEAPCACDVDSPVECWLCRWHSRATAALAARPAVVDGAEVGEAAERLETWTDPATGDQYAHGRCVGAPASAGIGEAAKIIRRIVTNHDARITERGVLVYGRPSVSTGFVDAIEWLRRYDAALRGGQKGGE